MNKICRLQLYKEENCKNTDSPDKKSYLLNDDNPLKDNINPSNNDPYSFLMKVRSENYVDAVTSFDMINHNTCQVSKMIENLVDSDFFYDYTNMSANDMIEDIYLCIKEEMEDKIKRLEGSTESFLGILAPCFIKGCFVHSINENGRILHHYTKDETLEDTFERGRKAFASQPDCRLVEIYKSFCLIIMDDGRVRKYDG